MNKMGITDQRSHAASSTEFDERLESLAQGSGTDMAELAAELRVKDQPERERAIRSLVAMLADPSPATRLQAADELVKIGIGSRHLLKKVCSESEPKEIAVIQRVLSEIDRLWDGSRLPEPYQMTATDSEMEEAILIAVSEAVIDLSRSALELLDGQETTISEENLLALLEINTDRQCSALHTLVSLGETSLGVLEPYFSDPDVLVRRVVANTVARIGTERAVGCMVTALKDKDVFVRDVAAAFLANFGTQEKLQPAPGS